YVGTGLASRDGKPLTWFQVSDGTKEGRDLKFASAAARIVGNDTVEVSSPDVAQPKFIRFAWHCEARHNLMNQEGLPAVSFRTDTEAK
ncbi:MAG TPA: sialate O-acetylesterase, partial [Phycisphaerae bacterium]|nr:sialate O-acetylesterase [Phycisphaerae bacterium]